MKSTTVLLIGNPNAGKSTLFNVLTGGHARVGNWHGVTVHETVAETGKRAEKRDGAQLKVVDLPGIYSLRSMSMEERYTCDYLHSHPHDAVLFVAECATLPRTLSLLQEVANGRKVILVLTKRRAFERAGGKIDAVQLEARLKIPVMFAPKTRKEAQEAHRKILFLLKLPLAQVHSCSLGGEYRAATVGFSRLDNALCSPWVGIPVVLAILLSVFYLTFAPRSLGDFFKGQIQTLFTQTLAGRAQGISSPVVRALVADAILTGVGSVLGFLPQIAILFFFLICLEESGILSRLALLTDGAFSAIGLNGRAVFSLLMGFGCTAAAILTTRGLDDQRVQKRAILGLPYIPCSAKLPVFLTVTASWFENPFYGVVLLYVLGIGLSVAVGSLLKTEKSAPFMMELAPLQIPSPVFVFKSLLFQVKQFIIKTATVIFAFFLFTWLLSSFTFSFRFCSVEESMLAHLCGWLKYLFAPIGCADWKIAYAAFSGLVAKENVAGILSVFYGGFPYSPQSAFAFSCFILTCSPCVSAIAATAREVGFGRALLYATVQTGTAFVFSYLVYALLTGGWFAFFAVVALAAGMMVIRNTYVKKVHGNRADNAQKLHR